MKLQKLFNRGFTLIELLVVVAIIGLLASIVLVSLNAARLKAKDTKIISDANQIRNLMEAEYSSTGDYTNVKNGGNWNACSGATGAFAAQVNEACADIMSNETNCPKTFPVNMPLCEYFMTVVPDSPDKYSIDVALPGASASQGVGMYYCVGSSGRSSVSAGLNNNWTDPGCASNP